MKTPQTISLFGIFFALLGTPLLTHAEGHSVGLMVGQLWPAGNIGKNVDSTVAPGLSYEYAASDVFSAYAQSVRSIHNDGAMRIFSNALGIKANLVYFDKLAPYAMLGAGLYFVRKNYGLETARKTNFGLHLGLGAELDLSDLFFLGLELNIHNLFSGTVQLPVNGRTVISGRWTGFFLRGGVRF